MSLEDDARAELAALDARHLLRGERVLESRQGPVIQVDGREVINFASNDYLGLAGDPRLARAMASAAESFGVGAGASRLIIGNHVEHVRLESAIADWLQVGGVRTFSTGYAANVGVLTTLLEAGDVVISDELNHASIIDGCRLSKATIAIYPHRNVEALERLLRSTHGRRRIVVTESLFSMDGDIADLAAIAALAARHDAGLVVDEAHAIGVLGDEGRGLCAEFGVVPDLLIGTFGKALGTAGAFVATTRSIADLLWNRARSFVFSTGNPPAVAYATRVAIEIIRGSDGDIRRAHLATLGARLRSNSRVGGDPRSPIAPLIIGDESATMAMASSLLSAGILAQGIRPPTVPIGTSRIRFGLSAGHSTEQLSQLLTACST